MKVFETEVTAEQTVTVWYLLLGLLSPGWTDRHKFIPVVCELSHVWNLLNQTERTMTYIVWHLLWKAVVQGMSAGEVYSGVTFMGKKREGTRLFRSVCASETILQIA